LSAQYRECNTRSNIKTSSIFLTSAWRADKLLPKRTQLRSSKYLNNLIEQDGRGIKSRTRPMLSFKNFASAATTIAGIELLRRIHKDQFALTSLRIESQAAPALWNAVLAA
jgi:transposase-like protein